ncbi:nuclear transport factor 2 family protein [bacterium SCSIO 12741]|nr:nuclear transport factor 2 family protein [bacterium SCSIO 12741]
MDNQEAAWNEGDLEGFMDAYWKSDSLCFLSKNGKSCGWETVYNNYVKAYPDKEAMGKLEFEIDEMRTIGRLRYFVIGKWTLLRSKDTLGGYFSLVWMKQDGEWVIVFDHTS